MLSDYTPMVTLATSDPDRSRAFYEGTLGLEPGEEFGGGWSYRAGGTVLFIYPSSFAGTNQATAAAFMLPADEFDEELRSLREGGVALDTFDMEGVEWNDGVATMDGMRIAWFHDPDGNILNIGTRS